MKYFKYILKCFKENLTRFLSVIAIITLGIGFLVGLSTSSGDIRSSVSKMYDELNVMDVNLKSTIGFSDKTLDLLKEKDNEILATSILEPNETYFESQKLKTRMYSYDLENAKVNDLKLLDGRFPEAKNECVVLEDLKTYKKFKIGDEFKIKYQDLEQQELEETFKVVGIVKSPLFYSQAKEFSLTGSDRLDFIFYTDSNYRDKQVITDLFITYDDLNKLDHFSNKYQKEVISKQKDLEKLDEVILEQRRVEIKNAMYEEIKEKGLAEIRKYAGILGLDTEEKIQAFLEAQLIAQADNIKNEIEKEYQKLIPALGEEVISLSLKQNNSYLSLSQNTDKIDKISMIFPVFFYFIAALVSLTTMTRIVEEDRSSIGLFKSLGYSKGKILGKYVLYAIVCSVFGSLLGNAMGVYLLPYVIYNAFNSVYVLPKPVYSIDSIINIVSIVIMIATLFFVTLYVVLRSLKERPATLLQPKAPKPGKRLLIERWKGFWKHVSFKHKNTTRNIFRYKKNLIMMMIGVGGCVGLLLCAFGIRESFTDITTNQFKNNLTYELKLTVSDNEVLDLNQYEEIQDYGLIYEQNIYINDNREYPIRRIMGGSDLINYFNFHNGKKKLKFENNSVFIDKQIAEEFNLKVGDKLTFKDFKDEEFIITALVDNEVDNYIFIYDDDISSKYNAYLVNLNKGVDEKALVKDLSELKVNSIEVISEVKKSFDQMLQSVILIMVVVILCSLTLAAIVIYNLTNININERIREIATLKVLGYQNKEVYGYIFREINILATFGILLGFLIGPFLYKFIIHNIQMPGMYLSSKINPIHFLYAFLITLLFTFLVDLMFIPRLKHVKMVESLKCVE